MASMFFSFGTLLWYFAYFRLMSCGFRCPGPIIPKHGLSYARIESNISGRANEAYEKIRIKLHYDQSIEGKPYKELVQEAADFWANALAIKPVNGRLFKSRDCTSDMHLVDKQTKEKHCLGSCKNVTKCDEIKIPNEHLDVCKFCDSLGENCKVEGERGTGIENVDLFFYVSAIDTNMCLTDKPVAYAGPCEFENVRDRPVFALVNVCPAEAATHSDNKKAMLLTIKHEMMHALAFGDYLFKLFRDKDGTALWPRKPNGQPETENIESLNQKVLLEIEREWHVRGKPISTERWFLTTPSVVREAQAHFNCSDLEGAELEDFGGQLSQKSHFEARVFYDDAMKANMDTGKGLFSRLDFAVLEDSGWYQVDYSQAEKMDFGHQLGCDFCKKSCKFWMDTRRKEGTSVEPYCDTLDFMNREYFSCSGAKKLFSGCPFQKLPDYSLKAYQVPDSFEPSDELPRKYQNFDKIPGVDDFDVSKYGSIDVFSDSCPVPVEKVDVTPLAQDKIDCEKEPEDVKDEEDETNESSHIGSSSVLVSLLTLMVILL